MNKFMKLAIVLVVIGLAFTAYKVSKKGGPSEVGQVSLPGESTDQTAKNGSADGQPRDSSDKVADKGGDEVNSEDFMGGVTGKSAGGPFGKEGGSAADQDPNAVPREDGTGKTAGVAGGVGGLPGVGGAGGTASGMPGAGGVAGTQKNPDSNCFSFEYKHQKEALNKDIEDFLDYSNAFPILHQKVNQKTICVKVNGKAVAHKVSKYKDQQEILIGSVVGPESVIKVSYCTGAVKCKESCAVKTNRFMDDLMSDTGDEDEFKESWGDAKEQKKELTAKVKEFRNVASENKDLQKQSTVRTWDTVQTNEWVCKK